MLPLTNAVDGLREIMLSGANLIDVGFELGMLVGFMVSVSILAALTLRRGTAS